MTDPVHTNCLIVEEGSQSFLPPLPPNANVFQKFRRNFRKSVLISEKNPRCGHFYQTSTEVYNLRQEQAKLKLLLIHPCSVFQLYFEFYMGFVFLVCILYMPFDAAFDFHREDSLDSTFRVTSCFMCVFCFLDIFLRFNTGIADEKNKIVIMDRKEIIKRYLLSIHFIVDVLSSLPDSSIWTSDPRVDRIFDLFAMLKILRIKTMFDYLSRMAEYLNLNNDCFDVVRVLVLIFLVTNWLACFCYLIPQLRKAFTGHYDRRSWVVTWKVYDVDNITAYCRSLYRASAYVLGIRFETHKRKVMEEVVLTCFLYAFGKIFTCTMVVIIVYRLMIVRSFETKYQEIIEQVKRFIDRHKFPPELMEKMLVFYDYKYHKTYFNEGKMTALLSESLKKEVNAHTLTRLTETVSIFAELPEKVVVDILSHLHAEIYLPHDVIIKAGDTGDCMYFIASGTVAVSTPSGKEVCHLYDGAYFGEICLILKEVTKRTANVIALEICEVYTLSRRSFRVCLKDQKEMRKKLETESLARIEMTRIFEDAHQGAFMDLNK